MSLPNFDVDMMRLFKAIYDRGSLSSAAEEMNISIAAASRILSKLRLVFDDELFVRMAYGMTPTNRAKELYEPIRRMLVSYGELFSHPTFHPTTLERTIRIGGVDNAIYSFIRPALRGLFQAAPKMALDLRPLATDFLTSLKTGELDLVFYPTLSVPDEFVTETICTEALVWCARRGHPLTELAVTRPLTEADLSAYRIIRVSLLGGARTKWEVDPKGPFTRTGDIPSKAEEGRYGRLDHVLRGRGGAHVRLGLPHGAAPAACARRGALRARHDSRTLRRARNVRTAPHLALGAFGRPDALVVPQGTHPCRALDGTDGRQPAVDPQSLRKELPAASAPDSA